MRISSPIGEYDYRITAARLTRRGVELDGSLGAWQTTVVIEPKDAAPLAAGVAMLGALALVLSRRR